MYSALITVIFITSTVSLEQPHLGQLVQKYFSNMHDQFYVSIGVNSDMDQALFYWIRDWKSLYVVEQKEQFQILAIKPQNVYRIISKFPDKSEDIINQSTLAEICIKYYLSRPKLLIVNNRLNQNSILSSNNWNESLCRPDIIFMKASPQQQGVQNYLNDLGFVKKGNTSNFIQYVQKQIYQAQTSKQPNIKQSESKQLPLKTMLEIIGSSYTQRRMAFARYMSDEWLIMDDMAESISSQLRQNDILIPNYRIQTDFIVIGSQIYEITLKKIREYQFYRVHLRHEESICNIFIQFQTEKHLKLKLVDLEGKKEISVVNGQIKTQKNSECPKVEPNQTQSKAIQPKQPIIEPGLKEKTNHQNESQINQKQTSSNEVVSHPPDQTANEILELSTMLIICCMLFICVWKCQFHKKPQRSNPQYSQASRLYIEVISQDQDSFRSND